MNNSGWIFGIISLILAGVAVIFEKRKTAKTMDKLDRMIESAKGGHFTEMTFDETHLSALETRFADYLSSSEASAQRIEEEKDRIKTLISDISHQTKTPIANLLLYTELLQEEELPESAKSSVNALYMQSEKLRFLIDSLVKLSRLESGIISVKPEENSIQVMLNDIERQYREKAERKGFYFHFIETEEQAFFDYKWTAEAIGNIVDNAIKYTKKGGIEVSVKAYELFICIDIKDTGKGIREEEYAKIFSRFYRGEAEEQQEGVGIGLYLARRIISEEGGYIKVSSEFGIGTTFSVFLPVEKNLSKL